MPANAIPLCPDISPKLITYLAAVFPDRACDPNELDPQRNFGRAEVVRHLALKMKEQEEDASHVWQQEED